MIRTLFTLLMSVLALAINAQVDFTSSMKQTAPDEITISFSGTMSQGWHVYSPTESNGPIPASFNVDKIKGAKVIGSLKANKPAKQQYEEIFGGVVQFYENNVTFTQKVKLTGGDYSIEGYLQYGACNEEMCMPPTSVDFSYSGTVEAKEEEKVEEELVANADSAAAVPADSVVSQPQEQLAMDSLLWAPAIDRLNSFSDETEANGEMSLWRILLLGMLGGFVAILTPCVWPIIPMTVSFFLKRASREEAKKNGDAKAKGQVVRTTKGITDAILYGVSIIVIYLALGIAVTLIFGASALNAMSTNAVFNIFFFLLLVAFGISFLGGFEITLPSKWSTAVDSKASSATGVLSIFLMAFTLALVSFSCTGPIIGFLLVEMGTSGNIIGPAVGMLGFATALALPFTLFAIFPTWLKSAPKSGDWMTDVKVVLGFIELAFAFKFLSVADLAYGWHILDREVFIIVWVVLFLLLGCYLMGWIGLFHNGRTSKSKVKFLGALCSFAFVVYMIPGIWGAPCKLISAFTPPMSTQHIKLYETEEVVGQYKDYEEGMHHAQQIKKPVMIDFTGFGCVNCRKMEAAVWTDDAVRKIITEDYVLIQLFVDDKTPLPEIIEVQENGKTTKLRTVGDKWSYLQRTRFGSNTQPFYVLLDNDGTPLTYSRSYDEDIDQYLRFLNSGLENYSGYSSKAKSTVER